MATRRKPWDVPGAFQQAGKTGLSYLMAQQATNPKEDNDISLSGLKSFIMKLLGQQNTPQPPDYTQSGGDLFG